MLTIFFCKIGTIHNLDLFFHLQSRYATIGLGSYLFREAEEDCVIVKVGKNVIHRRTLVMSELLTFKITYHSVFQVLKKHGAIPFFITNVPQLLMG